MEATSDNSYPNGAHSVRCTEEVLVPFFIDESLQVVMEREHAPAIQTVPPPLPEFRMVLLGRKGAGKSSAGNTILGGIGGFESGKPTEECVKRRAEVAGRRVTVVDTPGWEWYYPLNSTPDWVRRETLRSVTLCPPGPDAVLLVVRSCTSVTEAYIAQIDEHLEPLGKGVWDHTMVLFTRGDELGLMSIEQRIQSSGPALKKLLQKSGNRYHILDNRSKGDGTQVRELMRKLDEMAEGREEGSGHFGVDNMVLLGLEADRKRRARERRKKQRQMEAQMQRGTIKVALMSDGPQVSELDVRQSFSKGPRRFPELRLVLLGERETGKSSTGNTILGGTGFFQTGTVTEECVRQQADVATRLVTVVDTPGWERGVAGPTPERVKREMVGSVSQCSPGPHAVLLTLRVDTLVEVDPVREHLEVLGEGVWRHTVLLFTHGDQLREGVGIDQYIQSGGRDLQWLLEKCRGRYHVISNIDGGGSGGPSGVSTQVTELLEKVEKMAARNRCEAFSGLVQEISDLSQQKNEKFNQRLKEIGDKMLRQETELKKMREREVKSIRWFFDRKKKSPGKSPGKADVEKEEEEGEERRSGERKNEMGELEERMRWLTEDKEREVQDLNAEHDRVLAALHQGSREREEAVLKLEAKEREIEELQERIDEQQLKILDLERVDAENDRNRKQREDEVRGRQQEWRREVESLTERIEQQEKEKSELIKEVEGLRAEMLETKRHYEDIILQFENEDKRKAQENNREMAEMEHQLKGEMERRLREKEKQVEESKLEAKTALQEKQAALEGIKRREKDTERKLNEEVEEMKSQHQKEMERKKRENEEEVKGIKSQHEEETARKVYRIETLMEARRVQHQEEMDRKLKEKEDNMKRLKQQHEGEIRDLQQEQQRHIKELKQQTANQMEKHLQEKERETTDLERRFAARAEEQRRERKREKERIELEHEERVAQNLRDKTKEVEKLKRERDGEVENALRERDEVRGRLAEVEREMQRRLEERETEMKAVKLHVKDMEAKQREYEAKETENANYRKKMEQELQENQREAAEMKRHIREVEEHLRRQEEEKAKIVLAHEEEVGQRLREKERELEETRSRLVGEADGKLREKESEAERMRREADARETAWRDEQSKRDVRAEKEIDGLVEMIEKKSEEATRAQQSAAQLGRELEEARERCAKHLKEIEQLAERDKHQASSMAEMAEQERKLEARATEALQEKEAELDGLKRKDGENQREILQLKQTIEQTRSELKVLTGKMDREMTDMIQEQQHIVGRAEQMESIIKEKERAMSRLQRTEEERGRQISDITQKYEASRGRVEELCQQNEEMKQRIDVLKSRCEERERELDAQRSLSESREEEVRERLREHEERGKARDAEIQNVLNEREREVTALRRANETLRGELERTREREGEGEEQLKEMSERYQSQLVEKQSEMDKRERGIEKELLKRDREIEEREQDMSRSEGELSERAHELDAKEEAVVKREGKLERREEELKKQEVNLEAKQKELEEKQQEVVDKREEVLKQEQDINRRAQNIGKKEKELENWLQELENKQEDLSSYSQDLQEKVKEQKDWGRGLEDREHCLKTGEQELLNWRIELEMQNKLMDSKRQELDGMGRDLEKLREELENEGTDLKKTAEKLSKWEECLEKRETERELKHPDIDLFSGQYEVNGGEFHGQKSHPSHGKASCDLTAVINSHGAADHTHVMYQEVGVVDEQEGTDERRGREPDSGGFSKPSEDQTVETASSATENNGCPLETPEDVFPGGKEGVKQRAAADREEKTKKKEEGEELVCTKVIRGLRSSPRQGHRAANNKDLPESELRVVVLGESRSSRYPAGVTVLGREVSQPNGSPSRPWRGQVAGRRVSVVEPPGLRWRNGPELTDTVQRQSLLDGVSLSYPSPHVVLLVIPAYLTFTQKYRRAVEEHVNLLGEEMWQRTVVVFTWGETLGESAEQHILRSGDLMGLVEKCGGRYHVLTSKKNNSQIEGLFEKIDEMVALNNEEHCMV
ncbi:uncharacterized protein ACJ7VT_012933 [Polymixia lowei]